MCLRSRQRFEVRVRADAYGFDLTALRNLPSLRRLDLRNTRTNNTKLAEIRGLTSLRALYLRGTLVTDDGLAVVEFFPDLELLDLHALPITNDGLDHLRGLHRLTYLDIRNTRVSEAARRRLQRDLPYCRILYNAPKVHFAAGQGPVS